MVKRRIVYIIILVISLITITFFGGPISYGFFLLMVMIPVILALYLAIEYFSFRIYQKIDTRNVVANNTVSYYFTLQNAGIVPISGIKVMFFSSFSTVTGIDEAQYELSPKSGMKITTNLVCKYRGEYEVGVKEIEMCDFLGMFRIRFKNHESLRVIVRPEISHYDAIEDDDNVLFSAAESLVNREIADVLVREYVPGDDIRMIHWKASAALSKMMVRNKIGEEKNGIAIVLNAKRYSTDDMVYIPLEDKMLRRALSLAMYFVGKNTPVNAYTVAKDISVTGMENIEGFNAYYEQLSSITFSDKDTEDVKLSDPLFMSSLMQNRAVFIIVNKASDNVNYLADMLDKNNTAVSVVEVS